MVSEKVQTSTQSDCSVNAGKKIEPTEPTSPTSPKSPKSPKSPTTLNPSHSVLFEKYRSSPTYQKTITNGKELAWGLDKGHHHHLPPWRVKLRTFLYSTALEVFTFLLIALDVALSITSMAIPEDDSSRPAIFAVCGFIIMVLVIDLCLRIVDTGAVAYFKSCLNLFESFIVIISTIFFLVEAVTGSDPFPGTSIGRALRPAIRVAKVLRGLFSAFCTRGGMQGRIDRAADRVSDQLIEKYLGDVLVIPPDNATLRPSEAYFCLQKVQVKAEAFNDLHLPFTILGGAIELLIFDLDLPDANDKKKPSKDSGVVEDLKGSVVTITNMILVVGPGHAYPWDFDEIVRCQNRLVDLLCRRLEILLPKEDKKEKKQKEVDKKKTKDKASSPKKMVDDFVRGIIEKGFHVEIKNFTIRYEDTGKLGIPTVGCFQISSLSIGMELANEAHADDDGFRFKGMWRPGSSTSGHGALESPKEKPQSLEGKMIIMTCLRSMQVFWEVGHKAKPEQHRALAGQTIAMKEFLQKIRVAQNWEILRHAVCREIARDKPHSKGVRARRLREMILRRRYLLFPVNITSRGLFSPSQAMLYAPKEKATGTHCRQNSMQQRTPAKTKTSLFGSLTKKQDSKLMDLQDVVLEDPDTWQPMLDIDVHIPPIEVGVDPTQLASIQKVLAYKQEWTKENNRFVLQPFAKDTGRIPAHMRWQYAVRNILWRISPTYGWKVSSLLEMHRVQAVRAEYILVELDRKRHLERSKKRKVKDSDFVHHRRALELQVFMPMSEILRAQAVVAATEVALDVPSEDLETKDSPENAPSENLLHRSITDSKSGNLQALIADAKEKEKLNKVVVKKITKGHHAGQESQDNVESQGPQDIADVDGPTISRKKAMQVHVTLESTRLILFNAPTQEKPFRSRLLRCELKHLSTTICTHAPLDVQSGRGPVGFFPQLGCLLMEASIDNARIVYQVAPTSMPSMRRLLRRKPAGKGEVRQPLLHIRLGKSPAQGPDAVSKLVTNMKLGHLEVCACKPLLTNLHKHFGGGFKEHPGVDWFEENIENGRKYFVTHNKKVWKNQKDFEKISGLNSGSALHAEVILLGLTCKAIEPFTRSLWCRERIVLTPCTLKIDRGGDPAEFHLDFTVGEKAPLFGRSHDLEEDPFEYQPQPDTPRVNEFTEQELQDLDTKGLQSGCCKALDNRNLVSAIDNYVQSSKTPGFCKRALKCCSMDSSVAMHPVLLTPRADGAVTCSEKVNQLSLPDPSSDFWGVPVEVFVEVLTPEAADLPHPVSVPEMNFPGRAHEW